MNEDSNIGSIFPFRKKKTKKLITEQLTTEQFDEISIAAQKLWSAYFAPYSPPAWFVGNPKNFRSIINDLGPTATVYYTKSHPEQSTEEKQLRQQLIQREPTNIAMVKNFDINILENKLGWNESYYSEQYNETKLIPPNLAVYCQTPVVDVEGNLLEDRLHVINSIGLAFDSKIQPDYKFYLAAETKAAARRQMIKPVYFGIFKKIFVCAKEKGMKTVVMSLVGGGAFADEWNEFGHKGEVIYKGKNAFLQRIWLPMFKLAYEKYGSQFKVVFMGTEKEPDIIKQKLADIFKRNKKNPFKDIGFFPGNISHKGVDIPNTLFVNAWDPHSIAGNGNAEDQTLDGFFGRSSAIAILCWPLTNIFLSKYNEVVVNREDLDFPPVVGSSKILNRITDEEEEKFIKVCNLNSGNFNISILRRVDK